MDKKTLLIGGISLLLSASIIISAFIISHAIKQSVFELNQNLSDLTWINENLELLIYDVLDIEP